MRFRFLLLAFVFCPNPLGAQEHGRSGHGHADSDSTTLKLEPKLAPPKVFLDKSPRVVAYQLKRLDNQRLLMVERNTTDPKFLPVYSAILSRVGMSPQFLEEAVEAMVKLEQSDPVGVMLTAIGKFDVEDRDQRRAAHGLAAMLLGQETQRLHQQVGKLKDATDSDDAMIRSVGMAGLIVSGNTDDAIAKLDQDDAKLAFLSAIGLISNHQTRSSLRGQVVRLLKESDELPIQRAAVSALGWIEDGKASTFLLAAALISSDPLRDAAVKTLLTVPGGDREVEASQRLVHTLVDLAENTPAEDRTSGPFIDAMQLADQLMAKIPSDEAKSYRSRLDAVVVRVIRIKTVEEEMRYDLPYFAVQAGKSVQVVLENHDMMPHNLVFTTPGDLKEVAKLGLQAGPNGGWKGMQYVPESEKVLFASQMVPADKQEVLTFTAPIEPGEYPYVCTFPQHWYRMYGVMVVVDDLDAWLKNPVEPANPIGSNRSFVQSWTLSDLKEQLESGMKGRSAEIGKRIFVEASCASCHKVQGEGGVIGPDLTDVFQRWKGDRDSVLREILDPSHKVDAKYVMQRILTADGRTITGVLIAEDDDHVTLISNPEAKEPIVVAHDDIDAMVPSNVSMMPKALMDQYTKDELFELMSYLEAAGSQIGMTNDP